MSLRSKLVLTVVGLVFAAVSVSAVLSVRALDDLAQSQADARRVQGFEAIQRHARLLAKNLAVAAGLQIADGNTAHLKALAQSAMDDNAEVEWIAIYDATSDDVIVRTDGAPAGDLLDDSLGRRLARNPNDDAVIMDDVSDPQRLTFATDIHIAGRAIGQVRLGLTTAAMEREIDASVAQARAVARAKAKRYLLFAAVLLVLGIAIGGYQGMQIARPLRALTRQARHIAGGQFGDRVDVSSSDEIGVLADSFNTMSASLERLIEETAGKASMERELELARGVQEMMSPPPKLLPVGDFSLTGTCEMAEQCGGDWWTYRLLSRDRVLLVVGDVTGHGMPAAMIAATARGAVEALSMLDEEALSPPRLLGAIDQAIRDVGNTELLMTCFAVLLDPDQGKMLFANAGHNFPYVIRSDRDTGAVRLGVLAARGNPLGNPVPKMGAGEYELRAGDVILMSTDGLTDRVSVDGERYGDRRLRKLLIDAGDTRDMSDLRDRIVREVHAFGGPAPLDDDMTLVVCRYRGAAPAQPEAQVA